MQIIRATVFNLCGPNFVIKAIKSLGGANLACDLSRIYFFGMRSQSYLLLWHAISVVFTSLACDLSRIYFFGMRSQSYLLLWHAILVVFTSLACNLSRIY